MIDEISSARGKRGSTEPPEASIILTAGSYERVALQRRVARYTQGRPEISTFRRRTKTAKWRKPIRPWRRTNQRCNGPAATRITPWIRFSFMLLLRIVSRCFSFSLFSFSYIGNKSQAVISSNNYVTSMELCVYKVLAFLLLLFRLLQKAVFLFYSVSTVVLTIQGYDFARRHQRRSRDLSATLLHLCTLFSFHFDFFVESSWKKG